MGWARLRHRGQFVQPESSVEALETLRTLASAARAFVDEKCYFDSGASVKVKHMWKAWSGWCKEQDLGVGSKQKLRTDILAAFPKLGAPRNSAIGGETGRRWFGVELLDPVEE